jgi:hypothetical protein
MFKKDKTTSDAYTLSLGGVNVVTSFAAAPAIPHDRLRQNFVSQPRATRRQKWRLWIPR